MDASLLRDIGISFLIVAGAALAMAVVFLAVTIEQIRHLHLPSGMGFVATLRRVPFGLVLGLDLLDLALDFLSAPISWIILTKLNLQGLRTVTAIESLFPFTQPIPTLTLAWIVVRVLNISGDEPSLQWLDGRPPEPRQLPPRDDTRDH